jgi:hypothetical protein
MRTATAKRWIAYYVNGAEYREASSSAASTTVWHPR